MQASLPPTGTIKNRLLLQPVFFDLGSGGRIRTNDLRVMSPTSYHCSTPHSLLHCWKTSAKILHFFESTKSFLLFLSYNLIIRRLQTKPSDLTCKMYRPERRPETSISVLFPSNFLSIILRPSGSMIYMLAFCILSH